MMKKQGKRLLRVGVLLIFLFAFWTVAVKTVDVRPVGVNGTNVGFASLNLWFHDLTGVNMTLYNMTDILSVIPLFVCLAFGALGVFQLVKRKSLFKVDRDIVFLGVYYIFVIMGYVLFEAIPVNYRPILIEGVMETSYPSSTTLLVLSVMPTLAFQAKRRVADLKTQKIIAFFTAAFSLFMVGGRIISGVHWLTDIIGGALLSAGLYLVYKSAVAASDSDKRIH